MQLKTTILAAILVVLVAGSLGAGYFTGSNRRQTTTVTSTFIAFTTVTVVAPSSPCNEPLAYDTSNPISVLIASPNSTGQICVAYSNSLNNTETLTTYSQVYEYNSSNHNGCTLYCFITVNSIHITASRSSVTFVPSASPSSEIEVVNYNITIPSNATTGIYAISLQEFCTLFPMVVSHNGGPVISKSNFTSWYPHQLSCPAQVIGAQVLGVGGFGSVEAFY